MADDRATIQRLTDDEKIDTILDLQARLEALETENQRLRQSGDATLEPQLHAVLEHLPVMFDAIDEDRNLVFWNRQCEQITGYSKAEILNNPEWPHLLYPEPYQYEKMRQARPLADGTYTNIELDVTCKDGSIRTIAWSSAAGQVPLVGWKSWAIGIDVTERRQYEQALRESEQRYRVVSEMTSDFAYGIRVDESGQVHMEWVTESFQAITGYPQAQFLDIDRLRQIIHPDDVTLVETFVTDVVAGKDAVLPDYRIITASGDVRYLRSQFKIERAAKRGEGIYLYGIANDVTEVKLADEAMQTAERRYRALFNQSQDAVFVINLNKQRVDSNQYGVEMLGYTPEEFADVVEFDDIVPEDEIPHTEEVMGRLLAGESVPIYERTFIKKDGTRFPVEVNVSLIRDADGNPVSIMSICRDISKRKEMESRLRMSESWFRAVFDSHVLGILVLDSDTNIIEVDNAMSDALGYAPDELRQTPLAKYLHQDDLSLVREHLKYVREGRINSSQFPARGISKYGSIRWFDIVAAGQRDLGDVVQSIVVIASDITLEKKAEQRTLDLAVERERIRVITEFVSAASHEFRTPLSIIHTNLYLLQKRQTDTESARFIERIDSESRHILRLIEGLLLMVSLSNPDTFKFVTASVNELVETALSYAKSRIQKDGLKLEMDLDQSLPDLAVDGDQFIKALIHILDNATQYTEPGGTIRLMTRHKDHVVTIAISDTGAGIPEEVLPHVFDQFYRQDQARSTPGLGLGLSIASKIIEQHNGHIKIESELGSGTTVTITLPIVEAIAV